MLLRPSRPPPPCPAFWAVLCALLCAAPRPAAAEPSSGGDLSIDRALLQRYKPTDGIEATFMLLPEGVVPWKVAERQKVLSRGSFRQRKPPSNPVEEEMIVDVRSGYIALRNHGDGGGDSTELSFWSLKDKTFLVGVNRTVWGMCCDESKLLLLRFTGDGWRDVTEELFPAFTMADVVHARFLKPEERDKTPPLAISLPRRGTAITVEPGGELSMGYDGKVEALKMKKLLLKWNGERFVR